MMGHHDLLTMVINKIKDGVYGTHQEYPKVHTCWGQLQSKEGSHSMSPSSSSNHKRVLHLLDGT